MLSEPIVIEGFYTTRLLARRLIRFAGFVFLTGAGIALALFAAAVAAIDVFLISWGAVQ